MTQNAQFGLPSGEVLNLLILSRSKGELLTDRRLTNSEVAQAMRPSLRECRVTDIHLATQRSDDWPLEDIPLGVLGVLGVLGDDAPAKLDRGQRRKLFTHPMRPGSCLVFPMPPSAERVTAQSVKKENICRVIVTTTAGNTVEGAHVKEVFDRFQEESQLPYSESPHPESSRLASSPNQTSDQSTASQIEHRAVRKHDILCQSVACIASESQSWR